MTSAQLIADYQEASKLAVYMHQREKGRVADGGAGLCPAGIRAKELAATPSSPSMSDLTVAALLLVIVSASARICWRRLRRLI